MVFFKLHITMGLFDSKTTYEEMQPHMDEYSFSGETIAEIAAKVKRALGDDPSWVETAYIYLYYKSTACKGYLNAWSNVEDRTKLVNLIYGS